MVFPCCPNNPRLTVFCESVNSVLNDTATQGHDLWRNACVRVIYAMSLLFHPNTALPSKLIISKHYRSKENHYVTNEAKIVLLTLRNMVGNISADHSNQLFPWVQMSLKCIISVMWFLLLHKRILGQLQRADGETVREMLTHLGAVPVMGDWLFHFNSGDVKNDQSWYTSFPLWRSVTFLGQLLLCLMYLFLWVMASCTGKLGVCKLTCKHKH